MKLFTAEHVVETYLHAERQKGINPSSSYRVWSVCVTC
jgi:hypothetical protein